MVGPHDIAVLGAAVDGELVGFCFGGIFRGAMGGFLQKNQTYLAWRVVTHPWLITNSIFRDRLVSGLKVLKRLGKPKPATTVSKKSALSFVILSIAVHPRCQGLGVGRLLMKETEAIAHQRGFREVSLTVHPENHQAVRFYEGLGWKRILKDGLWDGYMTKVVQP